MGNTVTESGDEGEGDSCTEDQLCENRLAPVVHLFQTSRAELMVMVQPIEDNLHVNLT